MMHGEWEIAAMEPCRLPQKVATGFTEAFDGMRGAQYTPVLYCGSQIVSGVNHAIICKQVLVTREPVEHIVKVVLYENLDGKFQIISIENIL